MGRDRLAKTYTEKQVEAYKTRLFRQHQREIDEARTHMYERGKKDGKEQTVNALRFLLGLPEMTE